MKQLQFAVVVLILSVAGASQAQWHEHATPREFKTESPKKRIKWFYDQRRSGGEIPPNAYKEAVRKTAELRAAKLHGKQNTLALQPQWKLVGPENITLEDGYHAGRVLGLAVHPTNASIAYAGSANGGVWKTTNMGQSWKPLTDNLLSLAIGALAIDPKEPNTLYAGTGELSEGVGSYYGSGIIRTTDGGLTWKQVGLETVGAFSKIIVHPVSNNIVYVAGGKSGGGVFRSDDHGNTWRKLTNGLPSSGASDIALAISGENDVLFAGMPGAGIYRSMNGGQSWEPIQQYSEMRRIHLDVQPNNYRSVVALVSADGGTFQAAERSLDGGDTWNNIYTIERDIFNYGSPQGWYDIYIKIDPANEDRIFMGGISAWRTEDGGQSWEDVGKSYEGGIHPDQQNLAIAPSDPNVVYFANDGGVWVSTDGGTEIGVHEDDLAITQFYGITIDQTKDDLTYGGTQDNGTLFGPSDGNWTLMAQGDGSYVQVDENDPSTVFFVRPGDGNTLAPRRWRNGNETALTTGILSNDSVNWLKPLVYDSKNNKLYFGTGYLYVSSNRGNNWSRKTRKLAFSGSTITYIEPFGDARVLLLGTSAGKVYLTSNEGQTFEDKSTGLPGRWVTSVKFSPGSKITFYASLSGFGGGHVFKTDDGGSTWRDISSNLPDIAANELLIDPDNPNALYLATDVGVFFSPNDGGEWIPYGAGLPNVPIFDMDIHKTKRVLRIGTHGRSIWEIALSTDGAGITAPTAGSIWTLGQSAVVSWRGLSGEATIELSLNGGDSWINLGTSSSNRLDLGQVVNGPSNNAVVRVYTGADTLRTSLFQIRQLRAGMLSKVISQQPLYLYDIAYDPENNVLWATHFDPSATLLYKIHPDNGTILGTVDLGTGRNNLTGITYDSETKHLWVHAARPDNSSRMYEVTTDGDVLQSFNSPAVYGTGILVRGDTLYLVDRNPSDDGNRIFRVNKNDVSSAFEELYVTRRSPFGGRCLTYDPSTNQLLHTWTDFQGDDLSSRLYDSYLTWLEPSTGQEIKYSYVQEGLNQGTNVRGLELDPRNGGKSVWVTLLGDFAGSSTIMKLTLEDAPFSDVKRGNERYNGTASLGQNYPNPFNPSTTIPYTLTRGGDVEIVITDELGREVHRSASRYYNAGEQVETIDASRFSSGTYTYTLRVDGIRIDSKRMTLVK